jgi:hypothetical protein
MAGFFYRFTQGFKQSAGADGLALQRPQTLPVEDGALSYRVRGQLYSQAPAYLKAQQQFPDVSLVGNGLSLQGQIELQRLAELTKG